MASLVVWHLKTVPDYSTIEAVSRGNQEIDASIVRSIICIGRLIAHFDVSRWRVDSVYAWHVAAQTERDIIKQFLDLLADVKPQLVSWDARPEKQRRQIFRIGGPGRAKPHWITSGSKKARSRQRCLATWEHSNLLAD